MHLHIIKYTVEQEDPKLFQACLNLFQSHNPVSAFKFIIKLKTIKSLFLGHIGYIPSVNQSTHGSSAQFSSVTQSCPTLCDPMNHSTPGLPVHHQLPKFTQTHVHQVRDAIQPSHPLSFPTPPAPNPSQHQSLFQ